MAKAFFSAKTTPTWPPSRSIGRNTSPNGSEAPILSIPTPAGWKMAQLKAEQPSTGHPEFVRTCLTELATGHSTTYEIASGDYSHVNYSSGRLAHQRFNRSINVDRCRMERNCLNVILREWLK